MVAGERRPLPSIDGAEKDKENVQFSSQLAGSWRGNTRINIRVGVFWLL